MTHIGTPSGKLVSPTNLRACDVTLHDIAWNLSRTNRYNGATQGEPYSVAEHSLLCSYAVDQSDPALCMAALMHDAQEAYLGDMISPLKDSFKAYREIEACVAIQIGAALGYHSTYRFKDIELVDRAMLRKEIQELTLFPKHTYEDLPVMDLPEIKCIDWKQAYNQFMNRFNELKGALDDGRNKDRPK